MLDKNQVLKTGFHYKIFLYLGPLLFTKQFKFNEVLDKISFENLVFSTNLLMTDTVTMGLIFNTHQENTIRPR